MTITRKLTVASLGILLVVLVLSISSVLSTNRMENSLDTALNSTVAKAELAGGIRNSFEALKAEARATQIDYVIDLLKPRAAPSPAVPPSAPVKTGPAASPPEWDEEGAEPAPSPAAATNAPVTAAPQEETVDGVPCSACHALSAVDDHRQQFQNIVHEARTQLDRLHTLARTPAERDALEGLGSNLTTWNFLFDEYIREAGEGKFDRAHQILTQQMYPIVGEAEKAATQLAEAEHQESAAARLKGKQTGAASRWWTALTSILGVLVAAAVLLLVRHTSTVLRRVVGHLTSNSENVAGAAAQVAASSQSLAQGASQQAASLVQTAASMESMATVTHKNSDNSRAAAEFVAQSDKVVARMEDTIRDMSTSMGEIRTSGEKIVHVVKLIDSIAFQTRILALNAAVEAARAGSAGAGFAVVADQVGDLAQKCAAAAKSTAEMVELTVAGVRDGATRLQGVTGAIGEMSSNAKRIAHLVADVRSGSEEQARGIDQVARAVVQMEHVTQQTASDAEKAAETSRQLDTRAGQLLHAVQQLRALT